MSVELICGDALDVLRTLPDASVDAVVTDPPAGIGFMGRAWDHHKGGRAAWVAWLAPILAECRRVAKPGAALLCWAIPRTSHWTGCAVEDAGWQIEDRLANLKGNGYPKSKRRLKPAVEDWWLALAPGGNSLHLEVDRCRIPVAGGDPDGGRWPTNCVLTHAPDCGDRCAPGCPVPILDSQGGHHPSAARIKDKRCGKRPEYRASDRDAAKILTRLANRLGSRGHTDAGGASRYFHRFDADPGFLYVTGPANKAERAEAKGHPTPKPIALMQWLCRLATPPGGVVLDPFMGSGSTGVAALAEGLGFVGIEQSAEYHAIARRRIDAALASTPDP